MHCFTASLQYEKCELCVTWFTSFHFDFLLHFISCFFSLAAPIVDYSSIPGPRPVLWRWPGIVPNYDVWRSLNRCWPGINVSSFSYLVFCASALCIRSQAQTWMPWMLGKSTWCTSIDPSMLGFERVALYPMLHTQTEASSSFLVRSKNRWLKLSGEWYPPWLCVASPPVSRFELHSAWQCVGSKSFAASMNECKWARWPNMLKKSTIRLHMHIHVRIYMLWAVRTCYYHNCMSPMERERNMQSSHNALITSASKSTKNAQIAKWPLPQVMATQTKPTPAVPLRQFGKTVWGCLTGLG